MLAVGKDYFFKTDQLAVWRPTGLLDIEKIRHFIEFLNENSNTKDPHFDRFIDLSQVTSVSVKYEDLAPIAAQRKEYYGAKMTQTVKMAFLAKKPLVFGMTRMYQTLSDDSHVEFQICETEEEVSRFLDVDISLILP